MESIVPGNLNWELQRESICTHITTLKAFHNFLFIAEGNQILLYNWKERILLEKEIVFKSSSIHGIRIGDNNKVIFFGAKSIRIYAFQLSEENRLSKVSEEFYLDDWIHDVQWITNGLKVENRFMTISAHNSVTLWDFEKEEKEAFLCSENCILYTASIFCHDTKAIVIAAGTVFKKILLWSPNSLNSIGSRKLPFQSLSGHQGVIFSVIYSKFHKLICSTSDDRSVRLWKVQNDSNHDDELDFWEGACILGTHVLYAHESRVWMSSILKDCVLSVGEDSHLCFWSLSGNLLKKKKCNKGGSIWCLETALIPVSDGKTSEQYIAFTGDSDGGVYMWNVEDAFSAGQISQVSLHSTESSADSDFPRVTSLLTNQFADNLFVTTDKGWISLYNIKQKAWKNIFHDESFASYCVPAVSNKSLYLALGNICGEIVLLNLSEQLSEKSAFKKFTIHESKICSVHWVDKTSDHLLTCGIKGHMIFSRITYQNQTFEIQRLKKFHLPKCKHHWWSTASLYIANDKYIIVGDRGGTISLYSCQNGDSNDSELINPLMSHRYIHGENGVTDIQEHKSLIYSTGRDGKVQLYHICNGHLNLLHTIKVSHDLEWIGKMLFKGEDLLLLGFHTKDFIVWSTMLESAIMSVECGGGHRSWDFCLTEDGHATFTAIKKKDVIFCQENLQHVLEESILKAGISGQEFCHSTYLFTKHFNSCNSMSVVACGGEDNALRLIGFLDVPSHESQIVPICSLSGHLSSIRSISKVKMMHENVYLMVSVGGRSQMMIWKIKDDSNVECEQLASYILSDLNKNGRHTKESRNIQMSPQTRLMDVAVCHSETNQETSERYMISTACSDSYFRVYLFDAKLRDLSLCYNFHHGENCILKLAEILSKDSLKNNMFFATGSTDGCVKIFNSEMCRTGPSDTNHDSSILLKTVPHLQIKLHQSGINALDAKPITETTWFISSAGDDNALSVTLVNLITYPVESAKLEVTFKCHVPNAHSSQITGLKIFDQNAIVTASIDQRINIWSWNLTNNCLKVVLEISVMSLIPDIAHLEVWQNEISKSWTLLLCGQGLESLILSKYGRNRKRTIL